jgi:hypothetical protein
MVIIPKRGISWAAKGAENAEEPLISGKVAQITEFGIHDYMLPF